MASKSIQIRLDENLKKQAEQVFAAVGIDTPTAIRIFFTKVAAVGGIPFTLSSPEDNYSSGQLAAIDQLAAQAKTGKGLSRAFDSAEALIKDLHSAV